MGRQPAGLVHYQHKCRLVSKLVMVGPLRGGVGVSGVELDVGDARVAGALNLI